MCIRDSLRDYLEAHATEALGLDQLAQLLQRHPRHLIEAFRRAYGVPPHTYQPVSYTHLDVYKRQVMP